MPLISIDQSKKAAIDRTKVIAEANDWFAGEIAKGFTTPDGWVMGLTESDVTLLTGNFVLAKEAAALDQPLPPVIDRDGVPHSIPSLEALTALMLAYGQHRAALSAEYAARKSS